METFVGDTINIVLMTGIDLSDYIDLYIKFKRPDNTYGKWPATQSSENDTWMEYLTSQSDLNIKGKWAIQAHATGGTNRLHGKWINFQVLEPIADTTPPPTTAAP